VFEQVFKNIDDTLWKYAGCGNAGIVIKNISNFIKV